MSQTLPTSISQACREVLLTGDVRDKVMRSRAMVREWRHGELGHDFEATMPDEPARPARPELLSPAHMPKRGRGGSERGRIAMLHALAHIEFVAIDLAVDMVGRFGKEFPRAFCDDWLSVVADEAMHFALLARRLESLGSAYGALPAHAGLWESAEETSHDALARLAVVPMVLEARGLDVTPKTVERFSEAGDATSAKILERIYTDEIRHVSIGTKWFENLCERSGFEPHRTWKIMLERHFRGAIKGPFNDSARSEAGLTRDYISLVAS